MTASGPQVITAPIADATAPTRTLKAAGAQLLAAFPPRPVASSWPATEASRSEVVGRLLAAPFALPNRGSQQTRRLGVLAVLNWLHTFPGDSWHQRWHASGAQDQSDWRESIASATPSPHLGPGLLVLICADVIRCRDVRSARRIMQAGQGRVAGRPAGADAYRRDHGRQGRRGR